MIIDENIILSACKQLNTGASQLGLTLTEEQNGILIRYLKLIYHWNQVHNLTAVRDFQEMVTKHLLDSLAIAPYVIGQYLLDVGSGAGLPGIPLAVCHPHCQIVLLDSSAKKTQFLRYAKQQLNLPNVEVVNARVEVYQPTVKFNSIMVRALSNLSSLVEKTRSLFHEESIILAMKGSYPHDELAALFKIVPPESLKIDIIELHVPRLDAQRHLIMIKSLK